MLQPVGGPEPLPEPCSAGDSGTPNPALTRSLKPNPKVIKDDFLEILGTTLSSFFTEIFLSLAWEFLKNKQTLSCNLSYEAIKFHDCFIYCCDFKGLSNHSYTVLSFKKAFFSQFHKRQNI